MACESPVTLFGELVGFLEARVCTRAEFNGFLDEDPMFFILEMDSSPALPTGERVATMKPSERLKTLVDALRVRAAEKECKPVGGRRRDRPRWRWQWRYLRMLSWSCMPKHSVAPCDFRRIDGSR